MRAPMLLAFMVVSCAAQDSALPLVNLGRLSIARVFAMESAAGPDSERFYGVRNAFDGGTNILNGINYSSWLAGPGAFVIVRFSQPVTVHGIAVEGSRSSWIASPESFMVQIRSSSSQNLFLSSLIPLEGPRVVYATPRPVGNVREVMLTFQSKSGFAVEDIQILGHAPSGVDLSPVTPLRDSDLMWITSSQSQVNGPAQKALIRTLALMEIAKMRTSRSALDRAENSARKAEGWMELNRVAERLIELMGHDKELEPVGKLASAVGITVDWCEPSGHWFAGAQGYEEYLQILPSGPQAHDAWWLKRFGACGDFEGSADELEELIHWYGDFLKRFPDSSHASEARQLLNDAQEHYKALRPK